MRFIFLEVYYMIKFLKEKFIRIRTRSNYGWRKLRNQHIAKHPSCAICGYKSTKNDVHHIIPRHIDSSKVLDEDNLMTLCRKYSCHLRFGHFGNYRKYWNPNVKSLTSTGRKMAIFERDHKNHF